MLITEFSFQTTKINLPPTLLYRSHPTSTVFYLATPANREASLRNEQQEGKRWGKIQEGKAR
jgi:hypothetical protein